MINTVLGAIKKEALGVMLSHEHIFWNDKDLEALYFDKVYDAISLEQQYTQLLPVFEKLRQAGCSAVAEASPPEGGQNLKLMQKLSQATGMHLIANTGMIFSKRVFDIHKGAYVEEIAQRWIEDFEQGLDTIESVVIRPAQIKIFMSRGRLPEVDKKILEAAVIASKATGMPIHCHILEAKTAEEAIALLERLQCDFSKFLWAHASYEAERRVIDMAYATGMWLGYDTIRKENYPKHLELLAEAVEKGYTDRILLSQDYDLYEESSRSPDHHPCASLFTEFLPLCKAQGISELIMHEMLTKNPSNYLDGK